MKPKEYAKKFSPWKAENHNEFTDAFKGDILSTIETVFTLGKNKIALARMKSLTREAKEKFDRIRELIPEVPEGIWGYIFASAIKPTEKKLCAEEIAEEEARSKREKEWRNSFNSHQRNPFDGAASGFFEFFARLVMASTPGSDPEAQSFLELESTYTREDVNKAFKKKAFEAHPDHGGSHSSFLLLTEMKNRALRFASPD